MGLLKKIIKSIPEEIRWPVPRDQDILFLYMPPAGQLSSRTRIFLREGEKGLLITEGEPATIYDSGRRSLGPPQLTHLPGWDAFPGKILFLKSSSLKRFSWSLTPPITFSDPEYGRVEIQARGKASLRISQPARFYSRLALPEALLPAPGNTLSERALQGRLQEILARHIQRALLQPPIPGKGSRKLSLMDMVPNYDEFSRWLKVQIDPFFSECGLQLTHLLLSSLTLPQEIEEEIAARTQAGLAPVLPELTPGTSTPRGYLMARKIAEAFSRKY